MGIQPLHCGFHLFKDKKSYIFISGNSILLAFEDSTICVFDLHTKQVLDAVKIHSLKIKILWKYLGKAPETSWIPLLGFSQNQRWPTNINCRFCGRSIVLAQPFRQQQWQPQAAITGRVRHYAARFQHLVSFWIFTCKILKISSRIPNDESFLAMPTALHLPSAVVHQQHQMVSTWQRDWKMA